MQLARVMWLGSAAALLAPSFMACASRSTDNLSAPPGWAAGSGAAEGLERHYDKFRDQTTLRTKPFKVAGPWARGLSMQVSFTYAGQTTRGEPDSAWLMLSSSGKRWRFLRRSERELVLLLDGSTRLTPESVDYDNSVYGSDVLEMLGYALTTAEVRGLATARTVEGQVGGMTFALSEGELERIRALAARLAPARGASHH